MPPQQATGNYSLPPSWGQLASLPHAQTPAASGYDLPLAHGYPPAAPASQPGGPIYPQFPRPEPEQLEGDNRTVLFNEGIDPALIKVPTGAYHLQIREKDGSWRSLGPIETKGKVFGRAANVTGIPFLNSMAVRHVQFFYESRTLHVRALDSVNGVYVRLDPENPVELQEGDRFKVGAQVVEFHRADDYATIPAQISADGEEFQSCDLIPLAYLDLIRPDNLPGLRFAITRPDITKIGRGDIKGADVAVALPGVEYLSGQHAMIRHEGGKFLLQDLRSTNGTFVQIREPAALKSGDIVMVGRALLKVVETPAV